MAARVQVQREPILPNIGLDEKTMAETATILSHALSDEVVTAMRTLNYEYNVVSPRAKMLCDLFKEQACQQHNLADKICRHIRALGFKVPNLSEKLRMVRVEVPKEGEWPDCNTMISNLLMCHETITQNLCKDRERVKDLNVKSIEDLMLEMERCHMQFAWQLRSHLQSISPSGGKPQL